MSLVDGGPIGLVPNPPRYSVDQFDPDFVKWLQDNFEWLQAFMFYVRLGVGTPEGNVAAPPGVLYINTTGGINQTLWVKEVGTGNTGWDAK